MSRLVSLSMRARVWLPLDDEPAPLPAQPRMRERQRSEAANVERMRDLGGRRGPTAVRRISRVGRACWTSLILAGVSTLPAAAQTVVPRDTTRRPTSDTARAAADSGSRAAGDTVRRAQGDSARPGTADSV